MSRYFKLVNAETLEEEPIDDPVKLQEALMAGTHAFPKGKWVKAFDKYGKLKDVKSDDIHKAISAGWKAATPTQIEVQKYVHDNKGLSGKAKVLLGQFADEAFMGIPEMILEGSQDPLEVAKRDALKNEHELLNAVGGVGGFGASFLVGGPLFKAGATAGKGAAKLTQRGMFKVRQKMSANLREKMIAKGMSKGEAAEHARALSTRVFPYPTRHGLTRFAASAAPKTVGTIAEGATIAVPHAMTEAALGDPESAAEYLLAGGMFGGLFGLASSTGKLTAKATSKVVGADDLLEEIKEAYQKINIARKKPGTAREHYKELAGKKSIEALNPTTQRVRKLNTIKESLEENTILKKDLINNEDEVAKQAAETLLDSGIIQGLSSKRGMQKRLNQKIKETGKRIDDIVDEMDFSHNLRISPQNIAERASKYAQDKWFSLHAVTPARQKRIQGVIDSMGAAEGSFTLREALRQKTGFQKAMKDLANVDDRLVVDVNDMMQKSINQEIREVVLREVGEEGSAALLKAQSDFGNFKAFEKIIDDAATKEISLNDFGLTSFTSAPAGAVIGMGAGLGPAGAAVAAGGAFLGREFLRRYGDQISAIAYNKLAGARVAEQAIKGGGLKLGRIPKAIAKLANPLRNVTATGATVAGLMKLYQNEHREQRKAEARWKYIEMLNERIQKLANDAGSASDDFMTFSHPLMEGGAPNIGEALNFKAMDAVGYINRSIPKPPAPNNPFAPQIEWQPNDYELAAFERKLEVVNDPYVVIDELENGTLTRDHMEALKSVYPNIYAAIQLEVQKAVVDGVEPVPYESRANLSLLMGAPMDSSFSMQSVQYYQGSFAEKEAQEQGGVKADVNLANNHMTTSQRLGNV